MKNVGEVEQAVERLPPEQLAEFRNWFARYDAVQWDCQIERNVAAGQPDALAEEVIEDSRSGRCKDL